MGQGYRRELGTMRIVCLFSLSGGRILPLSGSTTRTTGPVLPSSRPSIGYDFDTLAADLHVLLSRLDLRGVVLAGFAMGTGEVTRYLAVHGPERVRAALLVAPLLPFLLKTEDSPEGIGRSVFDGITASIAADRPA